MPLIPSPGSSKDGMSLADFKIEKLYKRSRYNEIFLATTKSGKKVILKKIDKTKTKALFLQNEVKAATLINNKHINIVKFYGHFSEGDYKYLVLEFLQGNDLFEVLELHKFCPLTEKYAKKLFRQLVKTVQFLHKKGIVHRDIKLENIILLDNMRKIKLIDFGLCAVAESSMEKPMETWCGSPDYVCPEIMSHSPYIGWRADVWALGTVLFSLLFAELPFSLEERLTALSNNKEHPTLSIPSEIHVSDEAKQLVRLLLSVDPMKRPKIKQILNHPWLKPKSLWFGL